MGNLVKVGRAAEIAEDNPRVVQGPGKSIALFRVGGDFFAIDDMCPHAGGSLSAGPVEDGVVSCPWLGAVKGGCRRGCGAVTGRSQRRRR